MQITIEGHKVEMSDALRQHVTEKLEIIFEKYFGDAVEVTVQFSKHVSSGFYVRLSVHIGRGIHLQSHAESYGDAYACFDDAAEKMAKRLRRHKRKLRDHHRESEDRGQIPAQYYVLETPGKADENAEDVDIPDNPLVIAETQTALPHLTVSEAVLRLDVMDQTALLFYNEGRSRLNMVYRRKDGNIGWVDSDS